MSDQEPANMLAIDETTDTTAHEPTITVMSAEDALACLQAGRPLVNVRVSGLKFTGEFSLPVTLRDVILDKPVFKKAVFHETVEMIGCTISRARFEREPVFEKDFIIRISKIRRAIFGGITVRGSARFDRSEFLGGVTFTHCTFEGQARFWEATFDHWANFSHCRFQGQVDLRSTCFQQGVCLEHCLVQNDLLMRGAVVEKKLDFASTHFDGLLDLSKAKLHDFVYLEGISQGPQQTFAFANAVVDRLLIKPSQLQDRLASERSQDYELAMREYGLLKAIYQTLHRFDEEDWAYYKFKVCQRKGRPRSWAKPWTKLLQVCDLVFLDWGCGYGTNPVRAVVSALLMMLFFAGVYAVGYHHFEVESPPIVELPKDGLVNRVLYALMTTVSVFTSGFGGDQFNTAHGWVLIPLNLEALAGTLLWGLFVVAFSRKVIR